jgi:hypothetical protein
MLFVSSLDGIAGWFWQVHVEGTSLETLTGFTALDLPQRELALQQCNATFG